MGPRHPEGADVNGKMVLADLLMSRLVATVLWCVRNAIFAKLKKVKGNKMRPARALSAPLEAEKGSLGSFLPEFFLSFKSEKGLVRWCRPDSLWRCSVHLSGDVFSFSMSVFVVFTSNCKHCNCEHFFYGLCYTSWVAKIAYILGLIVWSAFLITL